MIVRLLAAAALTALAFPASAEFVGRLELAPAHCKEMGECQLVHDFGFYDQEGVGWQAKAGSKTDGASIPALAQPFIGGPWDDEFLRAAVLHDYYCVRTVRERTKTHRMFYGALIESGVSKVKAGVMYYAVLVGSHMWVDLMEGKPCPAMKFCVQKTPEGVSIPGTIIRVNVEGKKQAYRPPRFQDPIVRADIDQASSSIMSGNFPNAADIEELARRRNPSDFFLNNNDRVLFVDKKDTR